jgi:hypothetical protein
MERRKRKIIGETPIERQRVLKDGSLVVKLANSRPDGPVEPNSEEAMTIARRVRAQFEDKSKRSPSVWKERSFTSAED